jgi:type II secretory pathway component PulF
MKVEIFFTAIDSHGVKINSVFYGTLDEFEKYIKQKNYFVINFHKKVKKLNNKKFDLKDYLNFLEEMYFLINSGIPVDKSIKQLMENINTKSEKIFLENLYNYLTEGNQFSEALSKAFKDINFNGDNLSILLIRSNESIGELKFGLQKAFEHLKFKEKIISEIKQAMVYPIFLISMSILLVFFVFVFIVPKFAEIFTPDEFEKLPFLSRTILETGLYVNNNLYYIILCLIILSVLIFFKRKNILQSSINMFGNFKFFRPLILDLELSYFFESMSLMLKGGLDIKKALSLSSEIINYKPLKLLITKVKEEIKEGRKISESLAGTDLLESNVISLIATGENSANLDKVFHAVSERYLEEFNNYTKKILSLLEPFIIVLMGIIIGIIVVSIMMAVMSISDIV